MTTAPSPSSSSTIDEIREKAHDAVERRRIREGNVDALALAFARMVRVNPNAGKPENPFIYGEGGIPLTHWGVFLYFAKERKISEIEARRAKWCFVALESKIRNGVYSMRSDWELRDFVAEKGADSILIPLRRSCTKAYGDEFSRDFDEGEIRRASTILTDVAGPENSLKNCADCAKTEKLRPCPCRRVSYCSKHCQARDWKRHRIVCEWYWSDENVDEWMAKARKSDGGVFLVTSDGLFSSGVRRGDEHFVEAALRDVSDASSAKRSTLFSKFPPCRDCAKKIVDAEIGKVVFDGRDDEIVALFESAGVSAKALG